MKKTLLIKIPQELVGEKCISPESVLEERVALELEFLEV